MKQLPLPIQLDHRATFGGFVDGGNATAVSSLKALTTEPGEEQIYIWSGSGRGKTHLLQAVCHLAARQEIRAAYFPLRQVAHAGPELLRGLEQLNIVCLDDIETVCADAAWAEGLFHFINRCRAEGCRILVAADQGPRTLSVPLADLASRFTWGPVFHLNALLDEDLNEFIVRRGRGHGLELPVDVVSFLMLRTRRDVQQLVTLVDRLDVEALAQQRRITVPFAKSVLGL